MRAVVWNGPGRLDVVDKPVPAASPGHSLIRVELAGLCATDREVAAGAIPGVRMGVTPGHEITGVVVDSREPAPVEVGTRVVVDTVYGCGECDQCGRGDFGSCADPQELGYTADGGWAEFVVVRNSHLYAVPDALDVSEAVLCEPFVMPFGSLRRSHQDLDGRSVLVVGGGMAAFGFAAGAVALGASGVAVSVRTASRVARFHAIDARVRAGSEGELLGVGESFDIAVDTVGTTSSLRTAIAAVRSGGHVMAYGLHDHDVDLPLADVVMRNIRLEGYVNPPDAWPAFMRMLREGAIRLDGLVDRFISIDEVPQAVAAWGKNIRTVIDFRGPSGPVGA